MKNVLVAVCVAVITGCVASPAVGSPEQKRDNTWKYIGETKTKLVYYNTDVLSTFRSDDGQTNFTVWLQFTPAGFDPFSLESFIDRYVNVMIECSSKRIAESDIFDVDPEGKVRFRSASQSFEPINPGSIAELLHKEVCK